ncbi:hypothetical protein HGRIS_001902 [Hohenbuehelia grisea]|uniref:Uncharacterized protein n=1 Tax=Hohenbuehelia grisea TaxID=104357 RepID=A0ABR3JJU1_9AGAR
MLFALSTLFISTLFSILTENPTLASQVNVTVDDTLGAPGTGARITYSSSLWKDGRSCSGCTAHPDPSQLHLGTWTDASFASDHDSVIQTATLQFTGTAVYVFCAYEMSHVMDLSFSIDGISDPSRRFHRSASDTGDNFQYNVNVYSRRGLSNAPHTLTIQNGQPGGGFFTILLDYIVFTSETVDTPSPAPGHTSEIEPDPQPVSFATVTATLQGTVNSPTSTATVTSRADFSSSFIGSHTETTTSNATNISNTVTETSQMTVTQITQLSSATITPPPNDTSSPQAGTSAKSTPIKRTLTIIGAVFGTIGGMIIVCVLMFFYRRLAWRARQKRIAQLPMPFDKYGDMHDLPSNSDGHEHHGQADGPEASVSAMRALDGSHHPSSTIGVTEHSSHGIAGDGPNKSSLDSPRVSLDNDLPSQLYLPSSYQPGAGLPFPRTYPSIAHTSLWTPHPPAWDAATMAAISDTPPPSYAR